MYGKLCTEFYNADKKFASDEEIKLYEKIFSKDSLLLEPMCGTGRLLIPLLQNGFTVHGVDNSSHMLRSCRERAKQFGLDPILFETAVEDMTLPYRYDGILIPFGSFQLFYPRHLAFNALEIFKKHLKPGGKLVMDMFVPWGALYEQGEEEWSEREVKTAEDTIIKIKNHTVANKYEQFLLSNSTYAKYMNNEAVQEEQEQMYVAWYYQYEFELILEKFGFKNISYQQRFLNNEDHMTFICEY